MTHFDERSGYVVCETPWGRWWQTIDDVNIEIQLENLTRAKDILCKFSPKTLKIDVAAKTIIEGNLPKPIQADDSVWTLEDKKLLVICLVKSDKTASNCWRSLLVGQYEVNAYVFYQMERKLTLERFQLENPGMDFSGAEISGGYHGGGPELPS